MEDNKEKRPMTIKDQINWYLDRISDDKMLRRILDITNRLFVGGKIIIVADKEKRG